MGKKRIQRKPVALTFADTSNQQVNDRGVEQAQEGEGCSSSNTHIRDGTASGSRARQDEVNEINVDDDEVECMGTVSSSTAGPESRKGRPSKREQMRRQQEQVENRILRQEEEDLRRALELSRLEMQGPSCPNSTSDDIVTGNIGLGRLANSHDRILLEDAPSEGSAVDAEAGPSTVSHSDSQQRDSGGTASGVPDRDAMAVGEDLADNLSTVSNCGSDSRADFDVDSHAIDGDDDDDSDDTSVSSSILLDEGISAGQPEQSQQSSPTQSSDKVATVPPWQGQGREELQSQDIFDSEVGGGRNSSPELFVHNDSDDDLDDDEALPRPFSPYQRSSRIQDEEDEEVEEEIERRPTLENRKNRLSLRKRKRDMGDDDFMPNQAQGNRKKTPRLSPDQEDDEEGDDALGSVVNVEVDIEGSDQDDDCNDDGSSEPSQEQGFIDFPKRFPADPGTPLVDCRKPSHKSPFITPPGVAPSAYTSVILRLFYQYRLRLLRVQAQQRRRLDLSKPVVTGPTVPDTIVHKRRGQRFQWHLSSDDEAEGPGGSEAQGEGRDSETRVNGRSQVAIKNNLSHKNRILSNVDRCSSASASASTIDSLDQEPVTAILKPDVIRSKATSVSSEDTVVNRDGSPSSRAGDEVSSSKTLVRKVLPQKKSPRSSEWVSKADMVTSKNVSQQCSSLDDGDVEVELIPENSNSRTPLTATVSPRRSTPSESQAMRSPVFSRTNRDLVRPGRGQVRQVGHCSPRTVHNREKMESPQPSSPAPRMEHGTVVEVSIPEVTSGVSSTVPDNEPRSAMSFIGSSREASASEIRPTIVPTLRATADSNEAPACSSSTNQQFDPSLSYDEQRLMFYWRKTRRRDEAEGNGFPDVDSSNVSGSAEVNRVGNVNERLPNDGFPSHSQEPAGSASLIGNRLQSSLSTSDNALEQQEDQHASNDREAKGPQDIDQEPDEGAVSVGAGSSLDEEIATEERRTAHDEEPELVIEDQLRVTSGRRVVVEEEEEADEVHEQGEEAEQEEGGVQCPLCGVMFPVNVIEVHASTCEGHVDNGASPPREHNGRAEAAGGSRHPPPQNLGTRQGSKFIVADGNSSDEDEDDGEGDVSLIETRQASSKQPVRKRNLPSSGGTTSDSPNSSMGSMSHFDEAVRDMVLNKEITIVAGTAASSKHGNHSNQPAYKRAKVQSNAAANDVEEVEDDDDVEEEEMEKCFICNKHIPRSLYPRHVQDELDRMDAENSVSVVNDDEDTPQKKITRRSAAVGQREVDGNTNAASTSASSTSSTRMRTTMGGVRGEDATRVTRDELVANGRRKGLSKASSRRVEEEELDSEDEQSGPNSPSALDDYLYDSDEEEEEDEDDGEEDDVLNNGRDISKVPISDSPIKSFKSLKQNPACLIDFKNQFTTPAGKTPKRRATSASGTQGQGWGRGRGKGKSRGKWKGGKKKGGWGRKSKK